MKLLKKIQPLGQSLIEYAIIIGLIAVAVIAFANPITTWVAERFNTLNAGLP